MVLVCDVLRAVVEPEEEREERTLLGVTFVVDVVLCRPEVVPWRLVALRLPPKLLWRLLCPWRLPVDWVLLRPDVEERRL